jgi:hypothetical protein
MGFLPVFYRFSLVRRLSSGVLDNGGTNFLPMGPPARRYWEISGIDSMVLNYSFELRRVVEARSEATLFPRSVETLPRNVC